VRTNLYKRHRFPAEIISHCVWLYHRFDMSFRSVKELLFERGIDLSHETVRRWCLKFGSEYARRLKRRRAQPGDKWHLDEVFLNIGGQRHYLWRAVDQVGNPLDILVTRARDQRAAKRFLRKLLRLVLEEFTPRALSNNRWCLQVAGIRLYIGLIEPQRDELYASQRTQFSSLVVTLTSGMRGYTDEANKFNER
jgi:putative transposase